MSDELITLVASETVLTLHWRAELCTVGEVLPGGALMALADCAGAACASAGLRRGGSRGNLVARGAALGDDHRSGGRRC